MVSILNEIDNAMDYLQMFLSIFKLLSCHSNGKCILIVVLIDTHILLLWTFIISEPTKNKSKKFWEYKFWSILSLIATIFPLATFFPLPWQLWHMLVNNIYVWYSNTLHCIFSKFVKLYAKINKKMYIVPKNSHPSLLVLSQALLPCVYKVF